jgi:hypothetical protein
MEGASTEGLNLQSTILRMHRTIEPTLHHRHGIVMVFHRDTNLFFSRRPIKSIAFHAGDSALGLGPLDGVF